jgi:hypothetical protein
MQRSIAGSSTEIDPGELTTNAKAVVHGKVERALLVYQATKQELPRRVV